MERTIRTWQLSDAADLAAAMNNPNILNNLRDGIPTPYTQADAEEYIRTMLGAEPGSQYAFAIDVGGRAIGSIGIFRQANIHFRTAELGPRRMHQRGTADLRLCISKQRHPAYFRRAVCPQRRLVPGTGKGRIYFGGNSSEKCL